MKKIILMMLSLLVVFMFLIGCTEQTGETVEVTDESGNLVGEASKVKSGYQLKQSISGSSSSGGGRASL
jgi:hypothetical protein